MKAFLLTIVLFLSVASAAAQEIVVAAAADLSSVFPEIATRFQKETGKQVRVNYGSSGQFLLQIENGAPFDVFFSADLQYPQRLQSEGLTVPNSIYKYAVGKLVLYVPNRSTLNPAQGLRALLSPQVARVAIANPQHAPYGRAAVEALKKEGLYDQLQSKLVMGENISQAAQFVQSGNADAGIIAISLALSPAMKSAGRYSEIPASDYAPLEQAAVVLKNAKDKATAAQFLEYIRRPEIVQLLSQYGFTPPAK
ncbi:MAG TPA: molybdate ABC transporter substrate-binding protein [Candidatus Saccharimonadales bacterium]|nr:molybdate ABC transporter substrate-binding protein [Candidatus Saccharimonadales bacterium]